MADRIHLPTADDMRTITSANLEEIRRLPYLYIATADPEVMRVWGVALEATIADNVRLYPGALVAPHYSGETAARADLLYDGGEPAAAFVP